MSNHDKHEAANEDTSAKNGHRPTAAEGKSETRRVARAATQAASDALSATEEEAKKVMEAAEEAAQGAVSELKERLAPADSWLRETTKEHPYMVVGSAVGLSFLAGFLMRRRAAIGAGAAVGFLAGCLISRDRSRADKDVSDGTP